MLGQCYGGVDPVTGKSRPTADPDAASPLCRILAELPPGPKLFLVPIAAFGFRAAHSAAI